MRVLVTGSEGRIGRVQVARLLAEGMEVRTFDSRAAGRNHPAEHYPGDIRDIQAVRRAVQGVDAVVHLAAIPSDRNGAGSDVLEVNVQGASNILFSCVEADVPRVVFFSSINSLGCVGIHGRPQYLPLDDSHPHNPMTPYQLSKYIGEEACRCFSERYGIVTIGLRPVLVISPENYHWINDHQQRFTPERERPEFYAYVDVRDVCDAAFLAINASGILHDNFLLAAEDTTAPIPTRELADQQYPDLPWKVEREAYLNNNPYRSFIDCSHAKELLGWNPQHTWRTQSISGEMNV